ncbi:hypothetical protein CLV63_12184 [Murinocardiopsis flavida]|uniref:Uncharacterized protein n=1 Tax=Murinocardiopsis flavida TaxID=645275 RepID=A0A2P8D161_9ACTN|nr:hypothetical protein CLV63_12184 [Murinocardiopsis flavida]
MVKPSKAELDALVERAVVDAYGEYEQLTAFRTAVAQGNGARVQMELLRRFRGEPDILSGDGRPRRTVAELLDTTATPRHQGRIPAGIAPHRCSRRGHVRGSAGRDHPHHSRPRQGCLEAAKQLRPKHTPTRGNQTPPEDRGRGAGPRLGQQHRAQVPRSLHSSRGDGRFGQRPTPSAARAWRSRITTRIGRSCFAASRQPCQAPRWWGWSWPATSVRNCRGPRRWGVASARTPARNCQAPRRCAMDSAHHPHAELPSSAAVRDGLGPPPSRGTATVRGDAGPSRRTPTAGGSGGRHWKAPGLTPRQVGHTGEGATRV